MRRRDFLATSLGAGGLAATARAKGTHSVHFSPCLNESTTMGAPFAEECAAYAEAGFLNIELWFSKLAQQGLKPPQVDRILRGHGLRPVSACACEGYLSPRQGSLKSHLAELEKNFEIAQSLGIPRFVVYSYVEGETSQDDYKVATERLVRVAELAAQYKVRVALEFIARSSLLGSLLTSLQLIRGAGQSNVGICLDTFHFFAGISKLEDLQHLRPEEIEHVHFHDVPTWITREMLQDPDRLPPGRGIIPLGLITAALARIGYRGSLSTELFGKKYQTGNPEAIAQLCFKALQPYCRTPRSV
jgi:2-keto-myo-inositol isomerase